MGSARRSCSKGMPSAARGLPGGRAPDHDHVLEVAEAVANGAQLGQIVPRADARHDDERPGLALAQDEPDFLGAVEVDDGDQRHAQHGAGVEGDGRLDPVGKLEGHHVARTEAEFPQSAGDPERVLIDVAHGAGIGIGGRPDPEAPGRIGQQRVGQELSERAVVPRPFGPVARRQVTGDRSQLETNSHRTTQADSMNSEARRCRSWPAPPIRTSFCLTRLKRKWASLAQVKPTPPWSWMSSPVTRTPASAA